ncbi:MAG: HD-GYP domain-containing protein [Magnetococcales bacterium]|nr:HD-GYP domain-containing protein [Magnetococcales bacterium]
MIKKILTSQLAPGMFVHDFNHNWKDPCCQGRDPNFFATPRLITTEAELRRIIEHGIKDLYIDTARGDDVAGAPLQRQVEAELEAQLHELGESHREAARYQQVSMEKEMEQAAQIKRQARQMVGNILEDVRMGQQVVIGPMKDMVTQMADSMFRNRDAILSLGLIKQKDEYTFMHSVNVGVFMLSFCQTLGISSEDIVDVGLGAVLHDIGKMKTPMEILNKAGKLTDDEFAIMRQHVTYSRRILEQCQGISEISVHVASQHHERYDGSGYPKGLKGDQINQFGQMAAIADVYDAITSDRCYHKGNNPHLALKRMMEWSQYHFNPALFQYFVKCVGIYPMGTLVRLENDLLAVVLRPNSESLLHPVVNVMADAKQKKKIEPREIDLMAYKDMPEKKGYTIKSHEDHAKWGIDPKNYMDNKELYS